MPATGQEVIPRHINNNGAKIRYFITGAATAEEAASWVTANTPTTFAGFPRADFNADELEEILNDYYADVIYGVPNSFSPQSIGSLEYKFNFQAPGGVIKQSLATIAAYTHPDLGFSVDPDNFGGAINVVHDGGKYRVEGFNYTPPPENFVLSYRASSGTINGAYQSLVRSLQGKVNSVLYRGEPAGSLMLVRTTGGRDTSGTWYIEFGFGNIENETAPFDIGEITVAAKDGMDLMWVFYGNRPNATANGMAPQPQYVFIERIFKRVDFALLGLPP